MISEVKLGSPLPSPFKPLPRPPQLSPPKGGELLDLFQNTLDWDNIFMSGVQGVSKKEYDIIFCPTLLGEGGEGVCFQKLPKNEILVSFSGETFA